MASILDPGQPVDFNYFLARKYALMQQGADDASKNANTQATVGAAQAGNLTAEAGLTKVRTGLAPAESASSIALQAAQARLLREQASVVGPESAASIGQTLANTDQLGVQSAVLRREGLTTRSYLDDSPLTRQPAVGFAGFRLP